WNPPGVGLSPHARGDPDHGGVGRVDSTGGGSGIRGRELGGLGGRLPPIRDSVATPRHTHQRTRPPGYCRAARHPAPAPTGATPPYGPVTLVSLKKTCGLFCRACLKRVIPAGVTLVPVTVSWMRPGTPLSLSSAASVTAV